MQDDRKRGALLLAFALAMAVAATGARADSMGDAVAYAASTLAGGQGGPYEEHATAAAQCFTVNASWSQIATLAAARATGVAWAAHATLADIYAVPATRRCLRKIGLPAPSF